MTEKPVRKKTNLTAAERDRLTPRSRATTAWDLLTDVITTIRDQPLRFDMDTWFEMVNPYAPPTEDTPWMLRCRGRAEDWHPPECGTVACLAGWIVSLGRPRGVKPEGLAVNSDLAIYRLLGAPSAPRTDLDNQEYEQVADALQGLFLHKPFAAPGTAEHVEDVVTKLEILMSGHQEFLRRVRYHNGRVTIVPVELPPPAA